jgi:hypothetical protein
LASPVLDWTHARQAALQSLSQHTLSKQKRLLQSDGEEHELPSSPAPAPPPLLPP